MKPKLFVIRKQYAFTKPFVVCVDITEDIATVRYLKRVQVANGDILEFELFYCYLNRFELMQRADWKDNSKFSVHLKDFDVNAILLASNILDQLVADGHTNKEHMEKLLALHAGRKGTVNRNGYLVNISGLLQNSRIPSTEDHAFYPGYRVFNFFLRFTDTPFTKMFLSIPIDPETLIEHNCYEMPMLNSTELHTKWRNDEDVQNTVWQAQFALKADKVVLSKDDHAVVDVQLINSYTKEPLQKSCEVYLENVNGYLPKNRITLDEKGHGQFYFYPLFLERGDNMRVKVGFRFFPSKQDLAFTVM